jgi:hypothetical protein
MLLHRALKRGRLSGGRRFSLVIRLRLHAKTAVTQGILRSRFFKIVGLALLRGSAFLRIHCVLGLRYCARAKERKQYGDYK